MRKNSKDIFAAARFNIPRDSKVMNPEQLNQIAEFSYMFGQGAATMETANSSKSTSHKIH
jgi:hypothetical protein